MSSLSIVVFVLYFNLFVQVSVQAAFRHRYRLKSTSLAPVSKKNPKRYHPLPQRVDLVQNTRNLANDTNCNRGFSGHLFCNTVFLIGTCGLLESDLSPSDDFLEEFERSPGQSSSLFY